MFSRLILPLTYDCNLNCEYCYVVKTKGGESPPFLNGFKAIDFLMRNNRHNRKAEIIFVGGEPLLGWTRMKKVISYAPQAAKKMDVHIQTLGFPTNGLLLRQDILDFCKKEGIKIAVSLDGAQNKRKTANGRNSFTLLLKKLPLFYKYRDIIRIRMTIWPDYADQLIDNYKFFLKAGFTKIDIQPVIGVRWPSAKRDIYLKNLTDCFESARVQPKNRSQAIEMKHLNDFFGDCIQEKGCPKIKEEFLADLDGFIYPCEFFLSLPLQERRKYAIGHVDKGVSLGLAEGYKKQRICGFGKVLPAVKKKCGSCVASRACYKICLGFNVGRKKFDRVIADENWQLFREIEKIYTNYKDLAK